MPKTSITIIRDKDIHAATAVINIDLTKLEKKAQFRSVNISGKYTIEAFDGDNRLERCTGTNMTKREALRFLAGIQIGMFLTTGK
jgi:hypothetical protein